MPFRFADRVKETSTTTGVGAYSLAGAVAGFRTFVAGIGTTNLCHYVAEDGTDWEIGIGTVTAGAPDTLARTLILASSNAGAAVNWAAGTRNILCAPVAAERNPRTKKVKTRVTNATTTGAKVTDLDLANVLPGTYVYQYWLIVQSSAVGTGLKFGVNFTGTASAFPKRLNYGSTGAAAATGVPDDVSSILTGALIEHQTALANSTTAPNLGPYGGVATANAHLLNVVEGILEVTAAGTLELWHGSETAAQTSVEVGSCVVLTRIDD